MSVINPGVAERGTGILTCVFSVCRHISWCLTYDVYDEPCPTLRRHSSAICSSLCNVTENYKLKKRLNLNYERFFWLKLESLVFKLMEECNDQEPEFCTKCKTFVSYAKVILYYKTRYNYIKRPNIVKNPFQS